VIIRDGTPSLNHTPKRRLVQTAEAEHMTSEIPKSAPDIAAQLIANGYQPVPIPHGQKGPRIHGWQDRTFKPTDFAANANIGIRCGNSGVAFCDIDVYCPDTAKAIAAEWLRRFPAPHRNWMQRTGQPPKTGFLFRLPNSIAKITKKIAPTSFAPEGKDDGIEILCNGQQVVAFGIHPDTGQPYRWHGFDPTDFMGGVDDLPEIALEQLDGFLEWVSETYGPKQPTQPLSQQASAAAQPPTGHKGSVIDLGGPSASYTLSGPSETEARELLSYLDPDLPYGDWLSVLMALHDAGEHMSALAIEWSSKGRKFQPGEIEQKWRGFTRGSGVGWATIPAMARGNGANLTEIALKRATSAVNTTVTADIGQYGLKAEQPGAFPFVPVGSLRYRAPEYVIEGLLETETFGLIFGDPGCGKSFLAVDIAASVASGTQFHGRTTKRGSVFFIAGEGHNGLARRFAAWSKARSTSLADVPLFKSERAAQFLDVENARAVADAVSGLAAQHGAPALIVIDTLARNFGSGDENNTRDMSEFIVAIDDLKALFPGCSVLIVHHSGHADKQRARGAMALKGALDAEYRVEKPNDNALIRLICTKMKEAEPPNDMAFKFVPVDLGEAHSAVLESTDAPQRQKKLTPTEKLAVSTYHTAALEKGRWDDGAFMGVHVDDWRSAFYAKHTGDNTDAKKKAFQRARAELVDQGQFYVHNDLYLTRNPEEQLSILSSGTCGTCRDIGQNVPMQKPGIAGQAGHVLKACPAVPPRLGENSHRCGTQANLPIIHVRAGENDETLYRDCAQRRADANLPDPRWPDQS
jgi:hypothetical protein